MTPLNSKKPIEIYDDRNKTFNVFPVEKIIFDDDKQMLAEITYSDKPHRVCIDKSDNSVHSNLFNSGWYAKNYESEAMKKANEGIKYVKGAYVHRSDSEPFLLLGDVAQLIENLTGFKVDADDLLNK